MLSDLKPFLDIQELDIKMIRLMRLKKERQKELENLNKIKADLGKQASLKEGEISELKKTIRLMEGEVKDLVENLKKLEARQNAIKKVEEFNALTHEMSTVEKEKHNKEQRLSDLYDKQTVEEDFLKNLQQTLDQTRENSKSLEAEILESIHQINSEGKVLKKERDQLIHSVDSDILRVYERLLGNKKDRVIVPIENRCCSGCHILLTAQDENLVRKGERLVFCEHCSRIHYWQESKVVEGTTVAATKRRRRPTKVS